jgi:hypothetical protein
MAVKIHGGSSGSVYANPLKLLGGGVGGSSGGASLKPLKTWRRSAEAESHRYYVSMSVAALAACHALDEPAASISSHGMQSLQGGMP